MISFTAAYSKLHRLTEDGETSTRPPKILDMDEFKQAAKDVHMDEDSFHKLAVLKERKDRAEYPEKKYQALFGFKTWKPHTCLGVTEYNEPGDFESVRDLFQKVEGALDKQERDFSKGGLGFFCNIERFAMPYGTDPEQILGFFARVSEATEPFVVWHSNKEHDFTDLYDMDSNGIDSEVVYRIECRNGEGEIYKVAFEQVEEEKVTDKLNESTAEGGA